MTKTTLSKLVATVAIALLSTAAYGADAREVWTKNCQKCHGADGTGNTPIGKKLKVKNYADPAVQAAMTDEEIVRVTKEGAKDAAGKTLMPAYADKFTEEEINSLVGLIRSFKKE